MQERNIYSDIAKRTQGDIYIGVVGPVRTGKSTFIKRFMDALVLPNIESQSVRERAMELGIDVIDLEDLQGPDLARRLKALSR